MAPKKEITVEADVARSVLRQLHDDARLPFSVLSDRTGVGSGTLRAIHGGDVTHLAIETADRIYAVQGEVEADDRRLARRWRF